MPSVLPAVAVRLVAFVLAAACPTFCAPGGRPLPSALLASDSTYTYSIPADVFKLRSLRALHVATLDHLLLRTREPTVRLKFDPLRSVPNAGHSFSRQTLKSVNVV